MQILFLAIFSRVVSIAETQAMTYPGKPGNNPDACAKARYYQWPCA